MRLTFTLLLSCSMLAGLQSYAQCGTDPTSGVTAPTGAAIVVNTYYPSTASTTPGATSLTVGTVDSRTPTPVIAVGDLVVIMQMQGADFNSANTDVYGDGVAGAPGSGYLSSGVVAGQYEYATVAAVSGALITFVSPLANVYYHRNFSTTTGIQRYQVIRVPRNYDFTLASGNTVTAPPWLTTGGGSGGVVVIDAANTMTISGSINVTGLGFRGGGGKTFAGATAGNSNGLTALTNIDYRFNSAVTNTANLSGGAKGEGIAGTPIYRYSTGATTVVTGTAEGYIDGSMGWGAPGTAGGGGTDGLPVGSTQNQYNTGGGGGGNGGAGGKGGSGWHGGSGNVTTYPTGGFGGVAFSQASIGRFTMGGGGGAGTANNSVAADEYMVSGGVGGGIILLRAKLYAGTGSLVANGAPGPGIAAGGKTDGAGGGGAGGTIAAITRTTGATGLAGISASAAGGKGGNAEGHFDHGPGGGGGGGVIISNGTFSSSIVTAGATGLTRTGTATGPIDNPYGTTAATPGIVISLAGAPTFANASFGATACGILPVRLKAFTASLNGNSTVLNWEVDQVVDFAGFEVEFSTDGFNFISVGDVAYRSSQSKYEFVHTGNATAVSYYRLKLKDNNGKAEFSKILTIRQNVSNKSLMLYPQPAKGFTTVQVTAINKQQVQVQLLNAQGARVAQKLVQLGNGNNIFLFDNLGKFSSGLYTIRMTVDGKVQQAKVIISN